MQRIIYGSNRNPAVPKQSNFNPGTDLKKQIKESGKAWVGPRTNRRETLEILVAENCYRSIPLGIALPFAETGSSSKSVTSDAANPIVDANGCDRSHPCRFLVQSSCY